LLGVIQRLLVGAGFLPYRLEPRLVIAGGFFGAVAPIQEGPVTRIDNILMLCCISAFFVAVVLAVTTLLA
jgi:hypothetical protein